ncbi:dynein assembly factor 5, axonemal-like [Lytechinus variegatus]|uniref:dynein assembly factor 5, axonemal-like n=1 Tax=Lytechinus variegatus TaxID=7654 RepID=UPI001BB129D6|nr:dynein assembly factor 5, axonemal-like [Lytechinus variegatus]XP_041473461.1 dynein assembly factor 5, axonemal-like [Lytechinus variegatus]
MAAPTTEKIVEIRQAIARHINCLSEGSRMAKRRALDNIRKETIGKDPTYDAEVLQGVFEAEMKPLLKCFGDPVDKCRELSAQLVQEFVERIPRPSEILPYLVPTIVTRLGNQEIVESAEELRLSLVQLLTKLVELTGDKSAPFLDDFVKILQRTLVDPFADVRRESCTCTCKLARIIPQHFHMQSESLITPLLQTISHQHSKVRVQVIYTVGDVLQFGNHKPMEKVISHLAQRLFDQSPQVRLAVTNVVGGWLLDFVDRYSFHHKLIPLLLTSQTDELDEISSKAKQLWVDVGKKYAEENEKDLKDQMDFVDPEIELPPGYNERPNLGCRTLIFRNMSKILPGLLNDLTDWTITNRIMSAKLLHVLLVNAEDHTTQHMAPLLAGMYKACSDEEMEVVHRIQKSGELVGFYVGPEIYCKLILPTVQAAQGPGVLMTFASVLLGTKRAALKSYLVAICKTLAEPDVCRSEDKNYQNQLLSCVMSIILVAKEDCGDVTLELFTVLITIMATARDSELRDKVKSTLTDLAAASGHGTPASLYNAHTKQVLESFQSSYHQWTNLSVERLVFDCLLSEAGEVVGDLLEDIIPILETNLKPDKDAELRLKFFSLLSRLVMSAPVTLDSKDRFRDFSLTVVRTMVLPNCVWHAGRTATAIRTTAVSCLWALLQSEMLTAKQLDSIMDDLQVQLLTLLEDDSRSTRLITVRILQKILTVCGSTTFDPERLHQVYMELLKRLDDSSDEIRVAVAKTFGAFFGCFPEDYDVGLYKAHLETLYSGLLIHMDDPDQTIQEAVLDVLKQAAKVQPSLLIREIESVRHKHRSFIYCDQLIKHAQTLMQ